MATRRRVLMNSDWLFWCSWVKYLSGHSYPEVFAAVEELSEVKVKEVGFLAGAETISVTQVRLGCVTTAMNLAYGRTDSSGNAEGTSPGLEAEPLL